MRKAVTVNQQEKKESRVREYDSDNIYFQWLYRRRAMPMRINQILVKYVWIAALIFIVLNLSEPSFSPVIEILGITSGLVVFGWPITTLFLYFLLYAPMAVESDSRSSFMQFVFISPVPTREIVSNLRIFIFRQHFVTALPALVTLLVISSEGLCKGDYRYMEWDDFFTFFLTVVILVLIWWFLLESGVASAGLPKIAYSSGMIFLLWVIPALVAVFWGGYYLSVWHANFWFNIFGVRLDYYNYYSPVGYLEREEWMVAHYDIFLLIALMTARRLSYRFMALKRAGYWGT